MIYICNGYIYIQKYINPLYNNRNVVLHLQVLYNLALEEHLDNHNYIFECQIIYIFNCD